MTRKNSEIERLRAVAVLLTILVHAPFKQLFHRYLYSSFTGVDLFFVISGFVVSQSLLTTLPTPLGNTPVQRLERSRQPILAFYLRRVFRIAPSAFFYIFLYWIVAYVMSATGSIATFARPADIFREGVAFAGGIYNYAMVFGGIPTSMSHYYSLSIEEHFYLLAPMLLVLCGRTSYRLAVCAIGVALVLFVARPLTSVSIADLTHTRVDELLYGVIIALLIHKYRYLPLWRYHTLAGDNVAASPGLMRVLHGPRLRALLKTTVGIALCALLALLPGVLNTDVLGGGSGQFYFSSAAFCGYALVSVALVILASLERGWILNIRWLAPVLEYIGARSYSIYLGHVLLILVYNDLYFRFYERIPDFLKLTRVGYLIQFAVFLLLALALAEVTYRIVETPCRDFGKRVIRNFLEARE
ncbi:acyltransferase [Caballeronia sp. GAWG1-5s-s]|uniref:acyltransferase family protein n=1 Tax=Caballeronia sp. GAWG1-5s-s TaxID=2921743 RepID=UPI0020276E56|nr:acyltransferase [Caballeronia sp. GAWG1-5s-s]